MFIITLVRALLQASVASAYYGALNDMLTIGIVGCTWTSMGTPYVDLLSCATLLVES